MMQSAQDSVGNYDAAALDWPVVWGIFPQAEPVNREPQDDESQ